MRFVVDPLTVRIPGVWRVGTTLETDVFDTHPRINFLVNVDIGMTDLQTIDQLLDSYPMLKSVIIKEGKGLNRWIRESN